MNVVPLYKVIGPYNYDRIIHNTKNYGKRQNIGTSDKWKDGFDFQYKNLCNSSNTLKVKHLAS